MLLYFIINYSVLFSAEMTVAVIKLMGELSKGERLGKEKCWTDIAEDERLLGADNG